jgi:ubiquitin-protein ligase
MDDMDYLMHPYGEEDEEEGNNLNNADYTEPPVAAPVAVVEPRQIYAEPTEEDPVVPDSENPYFQSLKEFRFNTFDLVNATNPPHGQVSQLGDRTAMEARASRYMKEVKVLATALPCEPDSSIFIVQDQQRMDLFRVLVSGTDGTAYTHGLFLFDIACPADYPLSPPKMQLMTTANGLVAFGPNLYSNGYVCLSIINTWSGDPEERWNPSYSNLLQVLLSIQSLVMDENIISKEPGYAGYSVNSLDNIIYTTIVRYNNIRYAMIEQIRNPPPEFAPVILTHFRLKREVILATVTNWLIEARLVQFDFSDMHDAASGYNPHTVQIFQQRGYVNAWEEIVQELTEALEGLTLVP